MCVCVSYLSEEAKTGLKELFGNLQFAPLLGWLIMKK